MTTAERERLVNYHLGRVQAECPTRQRRASKLVGGLKMLALQAAATYECPFKLEQLTITAWRMFPERFGLRGYLDQFPDNNRISSCIHGVRGLVALGYLEKTPAGYIVTQAGLEALKGATQ